MKVIKECEVKPLQTLDNIQINTKVLVVNLQGNEKFIQKMLDMGVVPGTSIMIIHKAPMGDNIIVKLRGFELALRANEAKQIEVNPFDSCSNCEGKCF